MFDANCNERKKQEDCMAQGEEKNSGFFSGHAPQDDGTRSPGLRENFEMHIA